MEHPRSRRRLGQLIATRFYCWNANWYAISSQQCETKLYFGPSLPLSVQKWTFSSHLHYPPAQETRVLGWLAASMALQNIMWLTVSPYERRDRREAKMYQVVQLSHQVLLGPRLSCRTSHDRQNVRLYSVLLVLHTYFLDDGNSSFRRLS